VPVGGWGHIWAAQGNGERTGTGMQRVRGRFILRKKRDNLPGQGDKLKGKMLSKQECNLHPCEETQQAQGEGRGLVRCRVKIGLPASRLSSREITKTKRKATRRRELLARVTEQMRGGKQKDGVP